MAKMKKSTVQMAHEQPASLCM